MGRSSRVLLFVLLATFAAGALAAGDSIVWKPVTPAEIAMEKPIVDPDADAEAIFWEVRLDDKSRSKLYYEHYVRIKIFTERGREKYSKIDIKFLDDTKIENVAARVIKPDGSITNVSAAEFFERDLIKTKRFKVKAKSFAVPGIEPGIIVEYQYRERFKGDSLDGERLTFQRELPIQRATYWIRPFKDLDLKPTFFNMPEMKFSRDSADDEYFIATLKNVPAFEEEPFMAPEDTVRPWAFLEYRNFRSGWNSLGYERGRAFDYWTKPDKKATRLAVELTNGISGDEAKVRRIFDYVRKEFRNFSYDKSIAAPKKFKIKKATDLLSRRMGYANDLDLVFATLLRGIGMSPALVLSPDRSETFFNPEKMSAHPAFLHHAGIAVKIDGKWKFLKPGVPFLPFGRLLWWEENVYAMIAKSGGFAWQGVKMAEPEESAVKRKGDFRLDAEGNLEGKIEITYTGYQSSEKRRSGFSDEEAKRIEDLKESITVKFPGAEVSDIHIDNFDLPDLPLIHSYKIKIPKYAQMSGSRMFFQPGVFESTSKPVFSSSERKYPIYFSYPWSELDEIDIGLPMDFQLENFSAPTQVRETSKIAGSDYSVNYDIETHSLNYKRDFFFGDDETIYFLPQAYPALKTLFDKFHTSDTFSLVLKLRAQ